MSGQSCTRPGRALYALKNNQYVEKISWDFAWFFSIIFSVDSVWFVQYFYRWFVLKYACERGQSCTCEHAECAQRREGELWPENLARTPPGCRWVKPFQDSDWLSATRPRLFLFSDWLWIFFTILIGFQPPRHVCDTWALITCALHKPMWLDENGQNGFGYFERLWLALNLRTQQIPKITRVTCAIDTCANQ